MNNWSKQKDLYSDSVWSSTLNSVYYSVTDSVSNSVRLSVYYSVINSVKANAMLGLLTIRI